MRILLLVDYSKGPPFLLQYYANYKYRCPATETIKKNNREIVMNDAIYTSSIPSCLSLSSPMSAYVLIISAMDDP